MPSGVKTELSLEATEFIRAVLEIGSSMKTTKAEAEKAEDAVNKTMNAQEKQAKELSKFLNQNIKDEKKRRKEEEKSIKTKMAQLRQIDRMNAGLTKMKKESEKVLAVQQKRKKGLLEEVKIMKRLGQLSMATYAVGRFAGYAKAVAETVKDQEAMNAQMAVLESKNKGWIDALKQAQFETKGLVKMHELLSAVNIGESMQLGFKPEEFTELAMQAQRIAVKFQEPFDIAFTKLMKGIGRGSKKLLDDLIPGFRNLEDINADYAESLGKETSELTEQEKIMARKVEVLKQIKGISGDVTDEIIDQNLRLTKQLNKIDILWNKQKKGFTQLVTSFSEYIGVISTVEQDREDRFTNQQNRSTKAYLAFLKERHDKEIQSKELTERQKADLTLEYLEKTYDKEQAFLKKNETTLGVIRELQEAGLESDRLKTIQQELFNKAFQEEVTLWENKVAWQEHSGKLQKEHEDTAYKNYLAAITRWKNLKALSQGDFNEFMLRGRGVQVDGLTGLEETKCPKGYTKVGGFCRPIKTKKTGRAKKVSKPDYDAYVKAYALEVYGFDVTSDIVSKDAEKMFLKIQEEALRGKESGLKKLNNRIKSDRFDDGQGMLFGGVEGMFSAKQLENMTKALNYQAEMRAKGIEIDRESYIRQLEMEQEQEESRKQIRDNINQDFLEDKEIIFKQAEKMYDDAERNSLIKETEDLYNRRQVALALAGGTADQLVAIEVSKIKAMQELRDMDTKLEEDYQKEKIAIQKSALNHMINISKELGNVAYDALLRPASQAREQKELEMKIATINSTTEEGLAEQQKLRDDYASRREYEDKVWLDRAIGNALMSAGSQIYAQGITDLWKGGSMMFENPAAGALRMGYGALEVGVGAGLGYTGESMIPPTYQGRLEEDSQSDLNNINSLEDRQEIHAFMFPSQRQFMMTTANAVKGQRY